MSAELPRGWLTASLSDLLTTLESGSRPRGGVRGILAGIPSIGAEHLDYNGGFNLASIKYVPGAFARAMKKGRIECQDILVVKDGATTGKTSFVGDGFPFLNAVVNEHVFICRPSKEIEPRFLFRYLTSQQGQTRILENFKGSAQGGINQSFAPNTEVPLAPIDEQSRIVAKLDKLLGKVDACQLRLAKIPLLLKRFRQSVIAAACSGRLTADWRQRKEANDIPREKLLPRSWRTLPLGELIRCGPQNGLYKPGSFYGHGTLIVRIDAFYDGRIAAWNELKRLKLTDKERDQFALQNGDILVNRVNSSKYLGKSAVVRDLSEPCVYESNMMRLRLASGCCIPEYAILYLQSLRGLFELQKNAKHAVNQSSINQQDVKKASFDLPPLAEQHEIVCRVDALFAFADQIEARFKKAQTHVDKLTQSLLARAFSGKLVPQDPDDEPAEKLLERIRASRKAKT
jgi:type I restriction enzyme S subunit